jgi:hypothetical protein
LAWSGSGEQKRPSKKKKVKKLKCLGVSFEGWRLLL